MPTERPFRSASEWIAGSMDMKELSGCPITEATATTGSFFGAAKKDLLLVRDREVASTRGDQLERRGGIGRRVNRNVEAGLAEEVRSRARSRSRRDRGSASSRASAWRAACPAAAPAACGQGEDENDEPPPYACAGSHFQGTTNRSSSVTAPYSARASSERITTRREDQRGVERGLRLQHHEAEPSEDPAHSPKTAPTAA